MLPLLQYRRSQHTWFLLWWAVYESCAGIGRQVWFQEIRHLNRLRCTSNEGNVALDYIFGLLVEGESVSSDASVDCSAIEEAFDHFEEGGSGGKVVPEGKGKERTPSEDVGDHNKYLIIYIINIPYNISKCN